jgi:hypothetical protein
VASFQQRLIGALQLKARVFEDIEHDRGATLQAGAVVTMAAVSAGLANLTIGGLLTAAILNLIGWVIGAVVLLFVGTKLLPGKSTEADLGQMLRTSGFARAPLVFQLIGGVPFVGVVLLLVLWVWFLVAMVVAVRQALDYEDTQRALITCAVAWAIMALIHILSSLAGIGSATVASGVL